VQAPSKLSPWQVLMRKTDAASSSALDNIIGSPAPAPVSILAPLAGNGASATTIDIGITSLDAASTAPAASTLPAPASHTAAPRNNQSRDWLRILLFITFSRADDGFSLLLFR
jgi:hypothetical protein